MRCPDVVWSAAQAVARADARFELACWGLLFAATLALVTPFLLKTDDPEDG